MTAIALDWTLMMRENMGPNGLDESQFAALQAALENARSSVLKAVEENELGFWKLPSEGKHLDEVNRLVNVLSFDPTDVLVLGIGGSSLGPRTLTDFAHMTGASGKRRIHYLDNADPTSLKRNLSVLNPETTLVVVTSKSGSTVETLSAFLAVRKWLSTELGDKEQANHFVFITDPAKGFLRDLGNRENIPMLEVPPNVGGRFSVFTAVGLLPAVLAGIDCQALLQGAAQMARRCESENLPQNIGLQTAALHFLLDQERGRGQTVLMPYSDSLRTLGDWFVQLWGESLGKPTPNGPVGPTPLRAVGSTDQHSLLQLLMEGPDNKAVWFVQIDSHRDAGHLPDLFPAESAVDYLGGQTMQTLLHAERRATALALAEAGRPSATFHFPNESIEHLGGLIFLLEAATAFAGELYQVNAFDQPGVEAGKILTNALMGRAGFEDARLQLEQRESKMKKYRI